MFVADDRRSAKANGCCIFFVFTCVFLKKMENNKEEINKTRKKSGIG